MSDTSSSRRDFGYWLTIFANLAVVAGIIFLGYEIQQNSQMMKAQTRNDIAAGAVELLTLEVNDADFMAVILRGNRGEQLSDTEQYQYRRWNNAWYRYWENMHYQYRNDLYDRVEFSEQMEAIRVALSRSPGRRAYWCEVRSFYSPEYANDMDSLLATYPC